MAVAMNTYKITPVPKPRTTSREKWLIHKPWNRLSKREQVKARALQRYYSFKNEVIINNVRIPKAGAHIIFVMPMPESWSKKKKEKMYHRPHKQKPDKDNLEKALLDALFKNDSHIWDTRVSKIWGYLGEITIIYRRPDFLIGDEYISPGE